MFLKAGLVSQAKDCLNALILEGISPEEEGVIRGRISELEGNDAVEIRKEQFEKSGSIIDLMALIEELESRKDWDRLCEYYQLLFEKTRSIQNAERAVYSWSIAHNHEKLVEFFKANQDLLSQSKMLQFNYCAALYYDGKLLEARSELTKLGDAWNDFNYRALNINIVISLGEWNELLLIIGNELVHKEQRSAQELLFIAQLAIKLLVLVLSGQISSVSLT